MEKCVKINFCEIVMPNEKKYDVKLLSWAKIIKRPCCLKSLLFR